MWTKLDDGILDHPKIARVGLVGFAWFAAGLIYCNRNLTDGFIPYAVGRHLLTDEHVDVDGRIWRAGLSCGMTGQDVNEGAPMIVGWLLAAGLWEEVSGGYRVHDFHDYNPTKAEVLELRQKRSEAGRLGAQVTNTARAAADGRQAPRQMAVRSSGKKPAKLRPAPVPEKDQVQDQELPTESRESTLWWEQNGVTDHDETYLLGRLASIDERWTTLRRSRFAQIRNAAGAAAVKVALQHAWEEKLVPDDPNAWLQTAAIAAGGGAA